MFIYASEESLGIKCPACGIEPPVACGFDINGPLVHERRETKATYLPLTWYEGRGYRCDHCYLYVAIPHANVPRYCPKGCKK